MAEKKVAIKGTVKIRLPKAPRGEDQFVRGSINGETFQIKRGEEVEVSEAVAELIRNGEREKERADAYLDKVAR